MDRYSILLKKEYVIPRIPGEEFSWDYESRLRLVVMGGPGIGKTTYLINDLKNMTKIKKNPAKYIFCTSHGSLDHLRGLLTTNYALSGSVYGTQIEVCSWNDFWPRTVSLQRALTVYFDDANDYQTMETKENAGSAASLSWEPFNVRSLMAYAMGRLFNIPRIIIACDEHSIDFSTPIGNWDWKSEHLKKRGSV